MEDSSHIFKVGVEVTCLHFNPWRILKETTEPAGPFGTQEPWHPGKGAKLDHVLQLKCREVCTHASHKTIRRWKNFNNQGTKVILLSYELWLIANNSKSFVNGSSLIRRNNVGLGKHLKVTLFKTLKKIAIDLMV